MDQTGKKGIGPKRSAQSVVDVRNAATIEVALGSEAGKTTAVQPKRDVIVRAGSGVNVSADSGVNVNADRVGVDNLLCDDP
jgi:hypothetical protein